VGKAQHVAHSIATSEAKARGDIDAARDVVSQNREQEKEISELQTENKKLAADAAELLAIRDITASQAAPPELIEVAGPAPDALEEVKRWLRRGQVFSLALLVWVWIVAPVVNLFVQFPDLNLLLPEWFPTRLSFTFAVKMICCIVLRPSLAEMLVQGMSSGLTYVLLFGLLFSARMMLSDRVKVIYRARRVEKIDDKNDIDVRPHPLSLKKIKYQPNLWRYEYSQEIGFVDLDGVPTDFEGYFFQPEHPRAVVDARDWMNSIDSVAGAIGVFLYVMWLFVKFIFYSPMAISIYTMNQSFYARRRMLVVCAETYAHVFGTNVLASSESSVAYQRVSNYIYKFVENNHNRYRAMNLEFPLDDTRLFCNHVYEHHRQRRQSLPFQ
jgi:hypothetical protein